MKVLLITNIPNPYRLPLFNKLGKALDTRGHQFKVLFGAETYAGRNHKNDYSNLSFDYSFLRQKSWLVKKLVKPSVQTYSGLSSQVRKVRPDKIIVIGYSLATIKLWLLSFFMKFELIIWGGTIPTSPEARSKKRRFIRKILISRASAFLAYGTEAANYFENLGCAREKIFYAFNTVDVEFFSRIAQEPKPQNQGLLHLTYLGYLSQRKGVHVLIEIMEQIARTRNDFVLDILGSGDEQASLEKLVAQKGLADRVVFHGFRQKSELPAYLVKSDLFLFQTTFDIWGLVLNEAMAAGICCLSSKNAGATTDLIEHGKSGFVVDFQEITQTTALIHELLDDREKRTVTGRNASERIIRNFNLDIAVDGFLQCLNTK
ncbi:MAG: glycosyltransferase family 4 protein [Roseivirga sp.]|nr:glycosyltransferase family 4 protein [Roseivirga sp.]